MSNRASASAGASPWRAAAASCSRWAAPVGVVVVGAWLASGLYAGVLQAAARGGWPAAAGLAAVYLLAVGCTALALLRRGTWGNAGLLTLAVAGGCAVHAVTPFIGLAIIYLVAWVAPFRAHLWQAGVITALGTGGYIVASLPHDLDGDAVWGPALGLLWVLVLAGLLGHLAETRRRGAEMAEVRARQAVLDERQRLAREMHDILAHSLSAQIVYLEGARLLLERGGDTSQALRRVARAGDLAREGLAEAKRAVTALRETPVPLAEQVRRLAEVHRASSGRPCTVTACDVSEELSPAAALLCARTVQEALTNVRKHASGAEVSVALSRDRAHCLLEIVDTGGESGELAGTGGGFGLAGLRQRAERLGGTLDAEPDHPGFRVRLRVPA